jgi:hypothetical protein
MEGEESFIDALLKTVAILPHHTIILREDHVSQFSIRMDEIIRKMDEFRGNLAVVTKGKFNEVLGKVNHWPIFSPFHDTQ